MGPLQESDSGLPLTRIGVRIWVGMTVAIVVVTFALIVWSLNKGFDFTDESWVYSLTASNRVAVGEAWGFQHLMHPLFEAFGQSVVAFRVLRLLGYVLVSAVVVWALRTVAGRLRMTLSLWNWGAVLAVAQIGTFFPWAFGPPYISYNELAAWFTQIGISLFAVLLTERLVPASKARPTIALLLWGATGAVLVLLALSKVTSAVPFGAALAVVILIRGTGATLWRRVVAALVGAVIPLAILVLFGVPLSGYLNNLVHLALNSTARAALGHPIGEILGVYWTSMASTLETILPAVIVLLAAFALLGAVTWHHAPLAANARRAVVVITCLAAVIPFTFKADWFTYMGLLTIYLGLGAVFSTVFLLRPATSTEVAERRRVDSTPVVAIAILAVATPFVSTLGSGNPLAPELLWCMTLWAAVLGFGLVFGLQHLHERRSHLWMLPAALVLSVTAVTASAVWREAGHPYRTAALTQQGSSTEAAYLQGIRLTPAEASWSSWIHHQSLSLDAAGTPTIALASPGALLAFNNSNFASPWVADFWSVSFQSIETACTSVKPTEMFVLQPGDVGLDSPSATGASKALRNGCGFDFPADFRKVAVYSSPDPSLQLTIWRLR